MAGMFIKVGALAGESVDKAPGRRSVLAGVGDVELGRAHIVGGQGAGKVHARTSD